jgi:glycosyltransferase involved in cell wall biosynthesis
MFEASAELIDVPVVETARFVHPKPDFSMRPEVRGKFLFIGKEKYWVKGVTYGTFRPDDQGEQYPPRETVAQDFACMAAHGINTVRTYTPAPTWVLDEAQHAGLRVMVGLAWEQHVTFLDDKKLCATIVQRVRDGVRRCAGHPALLCFTIGNEIPPGIARWHGHCSIERFITRLYKLVKSEDEKALVTYVNYPTTEYLQLGFLDFLSFNVYLEEPEKLEPYLARLQNIAGDKPLVMAEMGLDSRRNGEQAQAESLSWQIRSVFTCGCAGMFVYAWTDEWYRGGYDIEDWDFGLTTRERNPKPALQAVVKAFAETPFPLDTAWPLMTVACCSHNGSATIRDTMEGLKNLIYPNYEVIVVNDGSTDDMAKIVAEYDVRLIHTESKGLSHARNIAWQEATGEIIAYLDDDAYPDPHWLHYIAWTFLNTDYVGVGGPNIAPPGDGRIADCVANSPGGPVHVLISDTEAEHIPGCNMAFRRDALAAVDGFDIRYRTAGDDVDVCWRLQQNGGRLGFHAGAVDWHHRRNDLKTYWKQQKGYGKAEAMLEEKWPHKYNAAGHFSWAGRLYGRGLTEAIHFKKPRIYGGSWGHALFQSMYRPAEGLWNSMPLMPEWYLITAVVAVLALLGVFWERLTWLWPLLVLGIMAPIVQAVLSSIKADFSTPRSTMREQLALRSLIVVMHLMQPLARLIGRLRHGLTPWRKRIAIKLKLKCLYSEELWSEEWCAPEVWLQNLVEKLLHEKIPATKGGDYDPWDVEVRGGMLGSARLQFAAEEHGDGKQMLRFRIVPRFGRIGVVLLALLCVLGCLALIDRVRIAEISVMVGCLVLLTQAAYEYCLAASALSYALNHTWNVACAKHSLRDADLCSAETEGSALGICDEGIEILS